MDKLQMMGRMLGEETAPKEPVARAMKRIDDAAKRGGFAGMLKATASRIKATKDPGKRAGLKTALANMIKELSSLEKQVA